MAEMTHKKLLFVVNVDWFFLSHRLPVALAAHKVGYEVMVVTGNSGRIQEIAEAGLLYIEAPVSRAGTNIFKELYVLWFLIKLYLKEKPDLVHHVTPKMVAYGSVAARLTNTLAINAVSGLGTIFSEESSHGLFRKIVLLLFKFGLKDRKQKVIFQNTDDQNLFISQNIILPQQSILIVGSGADLKKFNFAEKKKETPFIITLPARMLYDKGVVEFVEMARSIKQKNDNPPINFWLAGGTDTESAKGIPQSQLEDWHNEGVVTWLRYQTDMASILKQSDIIVFPSYREGLPKSLIETCAIGRPIVCFDVVGCREVVQHGVNGFLVAFKNIESMTEAVLTLIQDETLRLKMGKNGRKIAEERFGIEQVIEKTLAIYKSLLSKY